MSSKSPIEQPSQESNQESNEKQSFAPIKSGVKKVRNYQKVPEHLKQQLLKLVIQQGVKINQAAQQLDLKYATAKTIVFTYRAQSKPKKSKNKKKKVATRVEFIPIEQGRNQINVEISIGGNVQNTFTI